MQVALSYAQKASDMNEVPIGAVIVRNNQVIGAGHNSTITKNSVTAIRNKSYWNYNNLNPKDPVALNLFTQKDLVDALEKAERRIKREKKEKEKQAKLTST